MGYNGDLDEQEQAQRLHAVEGKNAPLKPPEAEPEPGPRCAEG